jgi:hypothetical protein
MGVQMPLRQAFIHGMVPSAERATVVSFDSMIGGIGAVGGQAGLGLYSERQSYSAAYVAGGLITLIALPILWVVRRSNTSGDFFEGTASPEPEACVPTGLPTIAAVETSVDQA